MKIVYVALAISLLSIPAFAGRYRQSSDDVYSGGYQRQNGTYVQPYYRSAPNANQWDNYNYKPYQPQYNAPRANPPTNWNTPNPGRWNDNNQYNNAPNPTFPNR